MMARTSRSPRIVAQPEMSGCPRSHAIGSSGGAVSAQPPGVPPVDPPVELALVVGIVIVLEPVPGSVAPVVPVDDDPALASVAPPVSVYGPMQAQSSAAPLTMLAIFRMVASQDRTHPTTILDAAGRLRPVQPSRRV